MPETVPGRSPSREPAAPAAAPPAGDSTLLDAVRAQGAQERARVLSEARARAAGIRADGEAEVRALRAELGRRFEREMGIERERVVGEASLAASARELAARRQWIGRVFEEAHAETVRLAQGAGYPAALERLLAQAEAAAGPGCLLVVREEDVELARRIAAGAGIAAAVTGEGHAPGTAIAVRAGRRVDNSLLSRLSESRRRMETEVARLLFEEAAP